MTPEHVLELAKRHDVMIATAESCTGGLIAAALTDIAGSSSVFERGFVTYSNAAKTEMLGVPADLIEREGAVSADVAQALAEGALAASKASLSVAVTGIAGPGGGSAEKPVGLVFIASAYRDRKTVVQEHRFGGGATNTPTRAAVRNATVEAALQLLADQLVGAPTP